MSTIAEPHFPPETWQLEIPGMDGYRAEKLAVSLSGQVELDATSTDDLDFLNGLKLGQQVSLKVVATVTKKGFTLTPGSEEKADSTGYGVGLKVHSLEAV